MKKFLQSALCGFLLSLPLVTFAQNERVMMQGHTFLRETDRHAKTVDALQEAGVGFFRDELYWSIVEQEKGVYKIPDSWNENLNILVDAGIKPLLILNYSNKLHDKEMGPHTEEGRKAFAAYCEFMARETRGRIAHFEIWNEPNHAGFWPPEPSPEDYAKLVKVAVPAIKRGNPDAYIMGMATSGVDKEFIEAAMKAGALEGLDAISIHPYCHPQSPEAANIFGRMEEIHELSGEYGEKKLPIWVTEFGYPTHDIGGITQDQQANFLVRAYIQAQCTDWLDVFGWYWFGPDGPDRLYNEDNFGLVNQDWSRKPSFAATRTMAAMTSGSSKGRMAIDNELHLCLFQNEGYMTLAAWTTEGVRHTTIKTDSPIGVTNRDGNFYWELSPVDEKVTLDISEEPLYIRSTTGIFPEFDDSDTHFLVDSIEVTTEAETDIQFELASDNFDTAESNSATMLLSKRDDDRMLSVKAGLNAPLGTQSLFVPVVENGSNKTVGLMQVRVNNIEPYDIEFTPMLPEPGENRFVKVTATNHSNAPIKLSVSASSDVDIVNPFIDFGEIAAKTTSEQTIEISSSSKTDQVVWLDVTSRLGSGRVDQSREHVAFATSPKRTKEIVIDGKLGDWPKVNPIRLNDKSHIAGQQYPWDGPEDSSAAVYTCWDDEYFYIAGEVTDDIFSAQVSGHEVYKNDGFEVYFDTDYEGDRDHLAYSEDDNQMGLFTQEGKPIVFAWSHRNDVLETGKIAFNLKPASADCIDNGPATYIVEAAIPMEELNLKPEVGKLIGFNIALDDDDTPETVHPFGQDAQLSWTGLKLAWQRPQQFGHLFLVDAKE